MALNSKFRNMFTVGKKSIDDEYSDKLRQLKRNQQKSLEKFMKSPDYVSGVTSPGINQINAAFKEKFAEAKKDYEERLSDYRRSVERKQFESRASRMR
jgi:hypothetical protein